VCYGVVCVIHELSVFECRAKKIVENLHENILQVRNTRKVGEKNGACSDGEN
jgi:hypothetical protein